MVESIFKQTVILKMGNNVVVLGTQWGDEGKGKIVDLLTERAKYVVRYRGGHNAGHTLVINGEKPFSILFHQAFCVKTSPASSVTASCCLRPR